MSSLSEPSGFFTVKRGDLAYLVTVHGDVVPVKVLNVHDYPVTARVQVTASRLGWRKGAVETLRNPGIGLVSRNQVRMSRGKPLIFGKTRLLTDGGSLTEAEEWRE